MNHNDTAYNAWLTAQNNPTIINKQLAILNHRSYLFIIVTRILYRNRLVEQEEAVSTIYYRLLKSLDLIDFTKPYHQFKSYLSRSASNHCYRKMTEKYQEIDRGCDEVEFNPNIYITEVEKTSDKLDLILVKANNFERKIAKLYMDGKTLDEVANELGYTKQHIQRTLRKLGRK